MNQKVIIASAVVLLAVPALVALPMVAGNAVATPKAQPVEMGQERLWHGEASPEVDRLIERLGGEVAQYPDLFGGVALSYDRQMVKLFVVDPSSISRISAIDAIVRDNPALIKVVDVNYSITELESHRDKAIEVLHGKDLVAASIDSMNNTVSLAVEKNSEAEAMLALPGNSSVLDPSLFKVELANQAELSAN
ncbi:hypothetical protein [Boudabousia marimammalium]|uniref:Uncharacterized protein n=1 Tax=Boudabousia marimammalium TaxID=156892 RepID=A0A1Q5PMP9_9ACTO|nr:hypothetical protein [Boudabousia marimammalium]OKL48720.1 hypothetical protein BM477_05870 [Boudabousia marimammalium]